MSFWIELGWLSPLLAAKLSAWGRTSSISTSHSSKSASPTLDPQMIAVVGFKLELSRIVQCNPGAFPPPSDYCRSEAAPSRPPPASAAPFDGSARPEPASTGQRVRESPRGHASEVQRELARRILNVRFDMSSFPTSDVRLEELLGADPQRYADFEHRQKLLKHGGWQPAAPIRGLGDLVDVPTYGCQLADAALEREKLLLGQWRRDRKCGASRRRRRSPVACPEPPRALPATVDPLGETARRQVTLAPSSMWAADLQGKTPTIRSISDEILPAAWTARSPE